MNLVSSSLEDTISHNCHVLMNLEEGQRLSVKAGRLVLDSHSARFRSLKKIAEVVDRTCQRLIQTIVSQHLPLDSNSTALSLERKKIAVLLTRIDPDYCSKETKEDLRELVESPETFEARLALREGIAPKPLNQTSSGTYVLFNRMKQEWGIFKPQIQELGGAKNPSWMLWLLGASTSSFGITPQTSFLRERVAYLLDKDHFADVPLTTISHFAHKNLDTSLFPKTPPPDLTGSFQIYKSNCQLANQTIYQDEYIEAGASKMLVLLHRLYIWTIRWFPLFFGRRIPASQIHKVAILDIRLLNSDRHLANLLVDKNGKTYPIDHGLILPTQAKQLRFDWKKLIHAREPLSWKERRYIQQLDPNKDAQVLRESGITDEGAIHRMKLSTYLLQAGVARGLSLYQIADLMLNGGMKQRDNFFEKVVCKRVLSRGKSRALVIDEVLNDYLSN